MSKTALVAVGGNSLIRAGEKGTIAEQLANTRRTAAAILGLIRLAQAAGSTVIGVGALIEKTFEGGRELLEAAGMKVEALARIASMAEDRIVFVD